MTTERNFATELTLCQETHAEAVQRCLPNASEEPWATVTAWQEAHQESIAAYRAWDAACKHPEKEGAVEARLRLQSAIEAVKNVEERLAALSGGGPPKPSMDALREAAEKLVAALDACLPALQGQAVFSHVHGQRYDGPTFNVELAALREALRVAPTAGHEEPT